MWRKRVSLEEEREGIEQENILVVDHLMVTVPQSLSERPAFPLQRNPCSQYLQAVSKSIRRRFMSLFYFQFSFCSSNEYYFSEPIYELVSVMMYLFAKNIFLRTYLLTHHLLGGSWRLSQWDLANLAAIVNFHPWCLLQTCHHLIQRLETAIIVNRFKTFDYLLLLSTLSDLTPKLWCNCSFFASSLWLIIATALLSKKSCTFAVQHWFGKRG